MMIIMINIDEMQSILEIIDKNKHNICENDYLQLCNILKNMYNKNSEYNHHDTYTTFISIFLINFMVVLQVVNIAILLSGFFTVSVAELLSA